ASTHHCRGDFPVGGSGLLAAVGRPVLHAGRNTEQQKGRDDNATRLMTTGKFHVGNLQTFVKNCHEKNASAQAYSQ
ncbi:MAG: hypothetical protein ACREF6_02590, partial [Alphaproteobacteria bacterium]